MYDLLYPLYLVYPQLGTNGRIDKLSGLGVSYVIMGGTFNDKMLSFWGIYGLQYHDKLYKRAQK